ncbi:hypothetical protein KI809_12405 [Geobacter pelophilus]|uniref:Uncharacterized protein n=1 Tax=Geoanaerobacter pelophilus TaxID=60036 RepID=A0AAW4L5K4_9BACT|nr:hypothetical protein [Geoanaerobacter pelophilus]MBT0665100.1 hypothetical protein [Geoanaerobacter pelophilus]
MARLRVFSGQVQTIFSFRAVIPAATASNQCERLTFPAGNAHRSTIYSFIGPLVAGANSRTPAAFFVTDKFSGANHDN